MFGFLNPKMNFFHIFAIFLQENAYILDSQSSLGNELYVFRCLKNISILPIRAMALLLHICMLVIATSLHERDHPAKNTVKHKSYQKKDLEKS